MPPSIQLAKKTESGIIRVSADYKRFDVLCCSQLAGDHDAGDFGILRRLKSQFKVLGFVWVIIDPNHPHSSTDKSLEQPCTSSLTVQEGHRLMLGFNDDLLASKVVGETLDSPDLG